MEILCAIISWNWFCKKSPFFPGGGDLYAGASGGGHYCENGVDIEIALLGILAAFAVSFAVLYMASTTNTSGKKKRDLSISDQIGDVLWKGKILPNSLRNLPNNYLWYHFPNRSWGLWK